MGGVVTGAEQQIVGGQTIPGAVCNTPFAQRFRRDFISTFPLGAQAIPPSLKTCFAYFPLTFHLPILGSHLVKIPTGR